MSDQGFKGGSPTGAGRGLRVLMAHWDGAGNIPPQRALARELVRRGAEVHVLTHDTLAASVGADGARFHALGPALQWNPAEPRSGEEEGRFILEHVAGSNAVALKVLDLWRALKPDVCVIDCMLVSTLDLALDQGLPVVAFNHLAWLPEGGCLGFLGGIAANAPTGGGGRRFLDLLLRAPLVLASSYRDLATEDVTAPQVHFVGPIREPVGATPWERRRPDRPLVLVSLSTMFQGQAETLTKLCQAVADLPVEVLVTTGRGVDPASLPPAANIETRSFVPHDAVLPQVDLVVTHGGLGTAMFSAGAGVPCLYVPNGRDQDDNAARFEALGLGRALAPGASPPSFARAIQDLLEDETMRAACRSFAARASRFGDLARAADLVQGLAVRS